MIKSVTPNGVSVSFYFLYLKVLLVCLLPYPASAATLAEPTGAVLLTLYGAIEKTNGSLLVDGESVPAARFDLEMLESLPVTTISTHSPWTDDKTEFTGVALADLINSVSATPSVLKLSAADDYHVDVPGKQIYDYPIVMAYKRDGAYMSTRDLGPLWVMYPFDDFPRLNVGENRARCVWQLTEIRVR